MAIPTGWDPSPLAPQIIIKDLAGVEKFRFESANILPAGTRDFALRAWAVDTGVNANQGFAALRIQDNDAILLDSTTNELLSKIKNQWEIQIFLGKTSALLQRWFYGKIMETSVVDSSPGEMEQRIFCGGWGVRTIDRLSNMKRFQKKQADGITLDATDNAARASDIFSDIFEDQDHHAVRSLGTESEITATPATIDIKLGDFQEQFQTWAHMMTRLSAIIGGFTYIDPDRVARFHPILSVDSGMLFINNETNLIGENWDDKRIGYIKNESFECKASSIDAAISILHLFGAQVELLDFDNNPAVNAVFDMSTKHIGIPFTPTSAKLQKLSLKLRRTGLPGTNFGDAFVKIVPATSAAPSAPKDEDVIKRTRIPAEILDALQTGSGTDVEIPFEEVKIDTDRDWFAIFEKHGDSSDHVGMEYITGAVADAYWSSDNGTSWASQIGGVVPAFFIRTYPTRAVNLIWVNTSGIRKFGIRERPIPIRDVNSQSVARSLAIGLSSVMSKERRILPPITVTAPTDRIIPGQWARIITARGLDMKADIIGCKIQGDAHTDQALGATQVDIILEAYR